MFGSILDDIKYEFRKGDTSMRLVMLFGFLFVLTWILEKAAPSIYEEVLIDWIAFTPSGFWKIWTWITYSFLHAGFWHVFSNCFMLWWFGSHFITFRKHQDILPIFIYGVLAGAAIHFGAAYLFEWIAPQSTLMRIYGVNNPMIGASAGVMAVLWATVAFSPDYELLILGRFRIRIKYIALILLILDLASIWSYSNIGGSLAHMAGAYIGYFYVKQLQNGKDWGKVILKEEKVEVHSRPSHLKVIRPKKQQTVAETDDETKLNMILDKINTSGIKSLSKTEKAFLDKMGND